MNLFDCLLDRKPTDNSRAVLTAYMIFDTSLISYTCLLLVFLPCFVLSSINLLLLLLANSFGVPGMTTRQPELLWPKSRLFRESASFTFIEHRREQPPCWIVPLLLDPTSGKCFSLFIPA